MKVKVKVMSDKVFCFCKAFFFEFLRYVPRWLAYFFAAFSGAAVALQCVGWDLLPLPDIF